MSCRLPPSVKTVRRRLCSPLTLSQAIDFAAHHCPNVKTISLVMTVNSSVVRRYRVRRRRPIKSSASMLVTYLFQKRGRGTCRVSGVDEPYNVAVRVGCYREHSDEAV